MIWRKKEQCNGLVTPKPDNTRSQSSMLSYKTLKEGISASSIENRTCFFLENCGSPNCNRRFVTAILVFVVERRGFSLNLALHPPSDRFNDCCQYYLCLEHGIEA